jgi:hypothetical protein
MFEPLKPREYHAAKQCLPTYSSKTVKDLVDIARNRNLVGDSKRSRPQLEVLIREADAASMSGDRR